MNHKQSDLLNVTGNDALHLAEVRKALTLTRPEAAGKASIMANRQEEIIGEPFHEKWLAQLEARKDRHGQLQEQFERKKIERLVWAYRKLFEVRGWKWVYRFSWEEQPVIRAVAAQAATSPTPPSIEGGDLEPPPAGGNDATDRNVYPPGQADRISTPLIVVGALSVIAIALWVVGAAGWGDWIPAFAGKTKPSRVDWISAVGLEIERFDVLDTSWDIWEERTRGKTSFFIFNHLGYPRAVESGDTVEGEFRWSYRYIGGAPEVFVTFYGEWAPEEAVEVFHGTLRGDGTITRSFRFVAADEPGVYRMRLFYSQAFAPVPSFYGAAPPNEVTAPIGGHYAEGQIEVLPRGSGVKVVHRSAGM